MRIPLAGLVRHSILASLASFSMSSAWCADVALAGLLPGRAVVVVNGGSPRTVSVGGKAADGVKLLAVESDAAVFEIEGKRQRLVLGEQSASSGGSGGGSTVTLTADGGGHFISAGSVNGAAMRFIVDTGASYVSLNAADAARAGIDYRRGQMGATSTANGLVRAWRVPGATVRLGDITLHEVEVSVIETSMPVALLGMSFLNRVEMKRDGDTMTLRKRY
ncbi:MAG: TIGR02281 family clan AA aspartic protease [Ignavibacteria bacterium]